MYSLKYMFLIPYWMAVWIARSCSEAIDPEVNRDPLYRIALELSKDQGFLWYKPKTEVFDYAAIDLDQKEIVESLNSQTIKGFEDALNVYRFGSNSMSYAYMTLNMPSLIAASKGSEAKGTAISGQTIYGSLLKELREGDMNVEVLYETIDSKTKHVGCRVGGSSEPLLRGCFASSGGITLADMTSGAMVAQYTYVPETDNRNDQTIQKFSTNAERTMWLCNSCPYQDFEKFYNYYGVFDYANEWIITTFEQGRTNFVEGNADFTNYGSKALAESIWRATLYMSIWMDVIREMEQAIDSCNNIVCDLDVDCEEMRVRSWDIAVATYTGLEQQEQAQGGYLLYSLANEQCAAFATCGLYGNETKGVASVNIKIFELFNQSQDHLLQGNCPLVETNKERIVQLMTIPLIQGTLFATHLLQKLNKKQLFSDRVHAEVSVFAASVLPLIHDCSPADAQIIHDTIQGNNNQFLLNNTTLFQQISEAFQRNYHCLGISCSDIGLLTTEIIAYDYRYVEDVSSEGCACLVERNSPQTTCDTGLGDAARETAPEDVVDSPPIQWILPEWVTESTESTTTPPPPTTTAPSPTTTIQPIVADDSTTTTTTTTTTTDLLQGNTSSTTEAVVNGITAIEETVDLLPRNESNHQESFHLPTSNTTVDNATQPPTPPYGTSGPPRPPRPAGGYCCPSSSSSSLATTAFTIMCLVMIVPVLV